MVYLHFPNHLTEEELMLQAKYQKLKKKKKALQALKAPKQEPEKPILPKRPTEARDAREIARKLIKSGAIQAIKSPPPQPQNATFKRPRVGRERKLSGSAGAAGGVASYQPFSASQEPPPPEEKPAPRVKYLYDSFVTAREKEEQKTPRHPGAGGETPTQNTGRSCTLQVTGPRISEETIRRRLAAYEFTFTQESDDDKEGDYPQCCRTQRTCVGNWIQGTTPRYQFSRWPLKAFLTFDNPDIAGQANTALDGLDQGWRVTVARRPPQQGAWAPSAAPRDPPPKDAKRSLLTYDDIFD